MDSLQQESVQLEERLKSKTQITLPPGLGSLDMTVLTNQLDSLRAIKSPDTVLAKYVVSMKVKSDSLQNLLKLPPQTEEVARQQQRVGEELNRLPLQENEKLKVFSEQGANIKQLPGFNFPDFVAPGVSAPDLNLHGAFLPSIALPGSGTTQPPGSALPSPPVPGIQSVGGSLPQVNTPTVPAMPDLKTEISKAGEVTRPIGEVSAAGKQIGETQQDLKTISSGNLDSLDSKLLESKLVSIDEVANAGGGLTEANRQADLLKKWNSDPLYQREMAVTLAKEQAVNHFAGHEAELLSVMEQLSQAKGKVKDVEQVVDLFAKPTNPMKDKPFIERLRPGVNLQVQWNQIVLVDINPYMGYRLSSRWTAGVGWNERVGFSSGNYSFSSRDRIYGPRAFVHFKFKESNFLILSPELMHTTVPAHTVPTGESTTKWVPGLMAGYRREFRYSKKVIGTVQMLYNLVAPSGQSPYVSRFNVLFGFEFPLEKKDKTVQ